MLSTNQCLFAIIALLAVIASGAVLENLDSNNQRHLPQPLAIPPLHENLRYAGKKRSSPLLHLFFPRAFTDDNDDTNPNDPAGNRISTTDPDVVTPSNGNEETTDPSDGNPDDTNDAINESVYTLSGSYTADTSFTTPIATGTVHTGGIGGGTSTGETTTTATTTTGVLGPNTTGSVPSGGNVVPSETASAGTSVTATATGGTGTQTGTGASATSVSGSASASASASATESSSESGSTFSPSTTSANQTGASQSQGAAAGNAVNVGGLLGLVGVGVGWLL